LTKKIAILGIVVPILLFLLCPSVFCRTAALVERQRENELDDKICAIEPVAYLKGVEEKITAFNDRIRSAELAENEETAVHLGVPIEALANRTEKLKFVKLIYERAVAALKEKAELERGLAILSENIAERQAAELSEKQPYNLGFYDSLFRKLSAVEQRAQVIRLEITLLEKLMETIQSRLESAKRNHRIVMDDAKETPVGGHSEANAYAMAGSRLEVDLLDAFQRLRGAELEALKIKLGEADLRAKQLRRNTVWVRKQILFSNEDLDSMLKAVEKKKHRLQARLEKLTVEEEQIHASWLKAQRQIKNTTDKNQRRLAEAVFQERDAWRKTYRETISLTNFLLLLTEGDRKILTYRYDIINRTPNDKELRSWKSDLEVKADYIRQFLEIKHEHQYSVQQEILSFEMQLSEGMVAPDIRKSYANRLKAVQKLAENQKESLTAIAHAGRVTEQILEEIDRRLGQMTLKKRWSRMAEVFESILDTEIWVIDDQPITLNKIAKGLLILVFGILAAKYLIQFFVRKLFSRTPVQATTVLAIQNTVSYITYFVVFLLALRRSIFL